jgi:adenosylcobinamide-GDP ribazoletransferase
MKRFALAVSFLTVIPLRLNEPPHPGDLGKAAGWFPVIGAVIGGLVVAAYYGLSFIFPPLPAGARAASVWIELTGGLHLDGLTDCFDGMLNASSRERRLEIMKDPRLGTFGGIGVFLAILLKIICLVQHAHPYGPDRFTSRGGGGAKLVTAGRETADGAFRWDGCGFCKRLE